MLEIKLTIEAPQLAAAIDHLAAALGTHPAPTSAAPMQQPAVTVQQPMPTTMPVAPAPIAPNSPAVPPVAGMPVAMPPQYTIDQIMQAGATLMDAGKVNELLNLLHNFGVNAVTDLKSEQLGAFATEMRKLGAQI